MLGWLLNLGFAGGSASVEAPGAWNVEASGVYVPGAAATEVYVPGAEKTGVYVAGTTEAEVKPG